MESDEQFPRITEGKCVFFACERDRQHFPPPRKWSVFSEQRPPAKTWPHWKRELRVELLSGSEVPYADCHWERTHPALSRKDSKKSTHGMHSRLTNAQIRRKTIVVALESRSMTITFPAYPPGTDSSYGQPIACKGMERMSGPLRNGAGRSDYCIEPNRTAQTSALSPFFIFTACGLDEQTACAGESETHVSLRFESRENRFFWDFRTRFHKQLQDICLIIRVWAELQYTKSSTMTAYWSEWYAAIGASCFASQFTLSAISMESLVAIPLNEPGFSFSTNHIIDKSKRTFARYEPTHYTSDGAKWKKRSKLPSRWGTKRRKSWKSRKTGIIRSWSFCFFDGDKKSIWGFDVQSGGNIRN